MPVRAISPGFMRHQSRPGLKRLRPKSVANGLRSRRSVVRIHWGALNSHSTSSVNALSQRVQPDALESTLDVADDQRCIDANDAIPSALERRITPRVSARALAVIRAIDLNHEPLRGSQEVRDEAPEQRHLAAKEHAQAAAANASPEELF